MDYKKIKVDIHASDEVAAIDSGTDLSSDPNHDPGNCIDKDDATESKAGNSCTDDEGSKEEPKEADPLLEEPTGKLFQIVQSMVGSLNFLVLVCLKDSLSEL